MRSLQNAILFFYLLQIFIFSLSTWFDSSNYEAISFWSAVGFTVIACFEGELIPFPIPYAIPITIFSSIWIKTMDSSTAWTKIMILLIFGTIGDTIGDYVDYLVGLGAEYVINKDDPKLQSRWGKIILNKPKLIPSIIVLFGLTPLPDSLLLVPLGFVTFSQKKVIIYMFIGKFFMMLLFALTALYTIDWLIALLEGGEDGGNGWIASMLLLYLIWIMMVFIMKYNLT